MTDTEHMPMRLSMKDMGIDPKTFHRDSACPEHGPFAELGGSLTGRTDRIRWFGCPACSKARQAEEAEQQRKADETARQARIEKRLQQAGVPLAFRGRTFDNYEAEHPEQQRILEIARHYADAFWSEHIRTGGSLVFGGKPGTGKSHLGLAIAQQVMQRGTAMYLDASTLVRRVRATWSRDSETSEETVLDQLGRVLDLLVIDEIGMTVGTENEQQILFDVLNRRYRELRPVILLTNLSGKELTDMLGERTIDRLKERATFLAFNWDSYRSKR